MLHQILVHGRKISVLEMTEEIDKVTGADIRRVAERIFGPDSGKKATVVCMGHEDVGHYESVLKKYGLSS